MKPGVLLTFMVSWVRMKPGVLLTLMVSWVRCQLVINVSRGGEDSTVFRQSLAGNITSDTVTIEYVTSSGVGVTQLADFRSGTTVTAFTVPGEQELGQPHYQVLCFVSTLVPDLIPPEAVTKLRQKHPGTVRVAEESRGTLVVDNPVGLVMGRAGHLSPHLGPLCREARDSTFAPSSLLAEYQAGSLALQQARRKGGDLSWPQAASFTSDQPPWESLSRCASMEPASREPCICAIDNCIFWYPCSLKYCRNNGGEGEHRCGIRTCSKCTTMRFISKHKNLCSWDQM